MHGSPLTGRVTLSRTTSMGKRRRKAYDCMGERVAEGKDRTTFFGIIIFVSSATLLPLTVCDGVAWMRAQFSELAFCRDGREWEGDAAMCIPRIGVGW